MALPFRSEQLQASVGTKTPSPPLAGRDEDLGSTGAGHCLGGVDFEGCVCVRGFAAGPPVGGGGSVFLRSNKVQVGDASGGGGGGV